MTSTQVCNDKAARDPIVLRRVSILQTVIGTAFVYPRPGYTLAGFETNDMRVCTNEAVHDWTWAKHASFKTRAFTLVEHPATGPQVCDEKTALYPFVLRRVSILQTVIGTAFVYPRPRYTLAGFESNDMRACNNEGGTRLDMDETRFVQDTGVHVVIFQRQALKCLMTKSPWKMDTRRRTIGSKAGAWCWLQNRPHSGV